MLMEICSQSTLDNGVVMRRDFPRAEPDASADDVGTAKRTDRKQARHRRPLVRIRSLFFQTRSDLETSLA